MSSLARKALGGVAWNGAASAVLVFAQIASTAATARLVVPREFGVYATAQAAAGFAGYFTMRAIGSGVLRRSQLGRRTVGTALVLSLASAFIVCLLLVAVASPWARAWGVPDAAPVVRATALTLFLISAAAVPLALIRRRLHFGRAALVDAGTQVAGLTAGVILAALYHSALALALGQAVGAGLLVVTASALASNELRLAFDRAEARELATFATQVSFLGFGSYATNTAPGWYAARAFGPSMLGLYSRANLIVSLPLTYASSSIQKVLYPLYGRVRDDAVRTARMLEEALTLTTGILWPVFALVAGAAPVIVRILLGPRWVGAAPLLSIIALAACADLPLGLLTNAGEAMGWMRVIAARQLLFGAGMVGTLLVVHVAGGSMRWLLAGVAASQWAAYGLTLEAFLRRRRIHAPVVLRSQAVHAGVSVAVFGAGAACAHVLKDAALPTQVLAQVAIGIAVLSVLLLGRSWFPGTDLLARRIGASWGRRTPSDGAVSVQ